MRAYAAHAGLSLGAIQKAKSSGRLVMHADGSIDVAASDARRARMTDPSKRGALKKKARPATSSAVDVLKAVPDAAVDAVKETLREEGVDVQEGMTYLQARTANEVLKAQERKLRVEKLKGQLVDVAQVRARVFRFAREQRDAWLNWPNRVAAVMAAELEVDTASLHAALVKEVRRQLEEIANSETSI